MAFKLSLVKAKEEERRENEILLTTHARTAQLSQVLVKLSLIHTNIDLLSAPTISHACYTSTTLAYSKCGVEGLLFDLFSNVPQPLKILHSGCSLVC